MKSVGQIHSAALSTTHREPRTRSGGSGRSNKKAHRPVGLLGAQHKQARRRRCASFSWHQHRAIEKDMPETSLAPISRRHKRPCRRSRVTPDLIRGNRIGEQAKSVPEISLAPISRRHKRPCRRSRVTPDLIRGNRIGEQTKSVPDTSRDIISRDS